jgi:tetratricopeptide (TPR) repeat protein
MHSEAQAAAMDGQVVWPVRSGAVPPLADGFIARPETIPDLGSALAPGAAVALVTAGGGRDWLGPCGKTQLAVASAEELWRSGGVDLLIWITASSRASMLAGYLAASAAALGRPPGGDGERAAVRFVRWLGETSLRWLVVLDGLPEAASLGGLWPEGPAGTVLITTTDPAVITEADPALLPGAHRARIVPVGPFSPREALGYLTGRLASDPDQRVGGADLIEDLGYEPLALAQATAVIASSAPSCRDYRERFALRRKQFTGQAPAAAATWTLSLDLADQLAPVTAQFLIVLSSLLDGHEIPGALFTTRAVGEYLAAAGGVATGSVAQADPQRVWGDVLTLERAGLVTVDPGRARTVRVSPVVQAAVRALIPGPALGGAARAVAAALLELWPLDEHSPWLAADLRSGTASLQRASGDVLWQDGCHPLLLRAGQSLDNAGLTGPAVAHWGELVVTGERVLGPGHPDTLLAYRQLAAAHLDLARPAEAAASLRRALAAGTRRLGPDHPGVVAVQVGLGRALIACDQPEDATAVLTEATAASERVHGGDHPDTLGARDEFAAAGQAAGRTGDAIACFRRTLADRERVQGPRHPDTITTRQRLAGAYLADGQVKQALAEHKRAVADRERMAGPEHADSVAARSLLAAAYYQAGRVSTALPLFEQVRDDSERLLGVDHPDTLARRASLANTYYSVGRLADARTLLRDTAERCEQLLPPGDPVRRAVRENLQRIAGQ